MSNQMPDSITRVLLAALNAADDMVERSSNLSGPTEVVCVAQALAELTKLEILDSADRRQNRFAATISLSMDKFRSAS